MSLSCTAIYTAPLVLFFSADSASLGGQFTTLSIPMLKTEDATGRHRRKGSLASAISSRVGSTWMPMSATD